MIENGQLSIPNAGMVSPDETVVGYDQFIDNFMAGHRFLTEVVGVDPAKLTKTTWQVNGSGLTNGFARVMKDMGYEAMFNCRMGFELKE